MKSQKNPNSISNLEQYAIDFAIRLRKSRRFTQGQIAAILDGSPAFIGNVENFHHGAKYNLRHINLLADTFDYRQNIFYQISRL